MEQKNRKITTRHHVVACILAAGLAGPQLACADVFTFTTNAEFDQGNLNGVNHDAPNDDQLQLDSTGTTFPIMWVANAGEDSVSRINTDTNKEEARYKTWYGNAFHSAWSGPAPSRTAVDIQGNVYVANRHFDSKPAQVMKILAEGGIDRNGNGVIDTSTDTNNDGIIQPSEMIVLSDSNFNGKLDDTELLDERVAWAVQVGPAGGLGRSLCIDTEGDIWLGLYSTRAYYELDPTDGSVKSGPIPNNITNYGCLVDREGVLYSANLGNNLGTLNTATKAVANKYHGTYGTNYGIAVGNGKVYLGSLSGRSYVEYDPTTDSFSAPAAAWTSTNGISVDGNGDIVLGRNPIYKFDGTTGAVKWSVPHPQGSVDVRGVIVDSNNDVWTVNLSTNTISKFDGDNGNHLATIPVGYKPYTYSDATGFAARNVTNPSGIWNVIQDSGQIATQWDNVSWNNEPEGNVPPGASIIVEVRAADTLADLVNEPFVPAENGLPLGLAGQFLGVRMTMQPDLNDNSPVLSDLMLTSVGGALPCDIDLDGDVDRNDINIIFAARGTVAAPGDPRDVNGDGVISVNDGRQCVLECTLPRCTVQ